MAAVFVEGWVFLLLTVTGARAKLITYVPRSIALAMSAGKRLLYCLRLWGCRGAAAASELPDCCVQHASSHTQPGACALLRDYCLCLFALCTCNSCKLSHRENREAKLASHTAAVVQGLGSSWLS